MFHNNVSRAEFPFPWRHINMSVINQSDHSCQIINKSNQRRQATTYASATPLPYYTLAETAKMALNCKYVQEYDFMQNNGYWLLPCPRPLRKRWNHPYRPQRGLLVGSAHDHYCAYRTTWRLICQQSMFNLLPREDISVHTVYVTSAVDNTNLILRVAYSLYRRTVANDVHYSFF